MVVGDRLVNQGVARRFLLRREVALGLAEPARKSDSEPGEVGEVVGRSSLAAVERPDRFLQDA